MKYQKPALTLEEQLALLESRNLVVNDKNHALLQLRNISYYRLSAYSLPFKQGEHFIDGTSFSKILELYKFDRKLRLLVLEAIEIIEISLRTQLIYHLSHTYGVLGYLVPENFSPRFKHNDWLQRLAKAASDSTETFIQHFKKKYTDSQDLPLWMALEIISFGSLSTLFKGLKGKDQEAIAKYFNVTGVALSSWLHTLVYTRNLCAHHARLWNRILTFKPTTKKISIFSQSKADNNKVYGLLCLIQYLLIKINPKLDWGSKLAKLLGCYPSIPIKAMGFPSDWHQFPLWNYWIKMGHSWDN